MKNTFKSSNRLREGVLFPVQVITLLACTSLVATAQTTTLPSGETDFTGDTIYGVGTSTGSVTINGDTVSGLTTQSGSLTVGDGSTASVNGNSTDGAGLIIIGVANAASGSTASMTISSGGTVTLTPGTDGSSTNASLWIGQSDDSGNAGTGTLTSSGNITVNDTASTGGYASIDVGYGTGSTATFNQTGGTVSLSNGSFEVGLGSSTGTYTMTNNASIASFGTTYIGQGDGGVGLLHISGNSTVTTGNGAYSQSYIGEGGGTGTITQDGTSTVTFNTPGGLAEFGVNGGDGSGGTGNYNLVSGTLNIQSALIFAFGYDTDTTGNLTQTGGSLTSNTNVIIGNNGTGTFSLSGGTAQLNNGLSLAVGSGSSGTVNLDTGGKLEVGGANGIQSGAGTYAFNLGGGTLQVIGSDLTTNVNLTLVGGKRSTIDTNGLNATLNGNIANDSSNNGGFIKTGAGNLTLAGSANSITSFYVTGGNVTQNAGSSLTAYELAVGTGTGNNGSYTLNGGTLIFPAGTPPSEAGGSAASFRIGDFGGTGLFTQTGGDVQVNGSMNIGNQGGTGTYDLSGGTLELQNGLFDVGLSSGVNGASSGTLNLSGTGVITVSGAAGTNFILGGRVAPGTGPTSGAGVGDVTMTGGSFIFDPNTALYLAGFSTGNTFNLDGGALEIGGNSLNGQYNNTIGTYQFNLGGGTIQVIGSDLNTNVNMTLVGGTRSTIDTNGFNATLSGNVTNDSSGNGGFTKIGAGNLTLAGSANSIASFYTTGGSVSQGAGSSLTSYEVSVGYGTGNSANYTMNGGSLLLAAGTPPSLVGGSASSLRIGDFGGTGYFYQTGGDVNVNGSLNIGNQGGNGTYYMNGGTLELDGLDTIGRSTTTTASTGELIIAGTAQVTVDGPAGTGVIVGNREIGGTTSSGLVDLAGGTFTFDAGTGLFLGGYGSSEFDLYSGTLQIGGNSLQGLYTGEGANNTGSYAFNLSGGKIQVIGSNLTTDVNATLVANSTTLIDTNGFNATWSGDIGGDGELNKTGSGTLTLDGTNTYQGGTLIQGGTLSVADDAALGAASGNVTVENSGKFVATGDLTTGRTFFLDNGFSTIVASAGDSITYTSGAAVYGGNLNGPGTQVFADGSSLNGTTVLPGTNISQSGGTVDFNVVTMSGNLTQAAGSTLNYNSGYVTSAGVFNINGTVNSSGLEVDGVTTINNHGTLSNSGTNLTLGGGSRTTINAGGTLSTAVGTSVELNGGLLVNNGIINGTVNDNFGSTVKGSGFFDTINVNPGGTLSAGNSPGKLSANLLTFAGGSSDNFEIQDATGAAGVGYDTIMANTLQITATPQAQLTVNILSVQGDSSALASDFDPTKAFQFVLAQVTNPITGFNANDFSLNTNGFLNNLDGGSFSIAEQGNDIVIDFTPGSVVVPEPSTYVLLLAGGLLLYVVRRRRNALDA